MPNRHPHTTIEMSPRPRRRSSHGGHESPNIHRGPMEHHHGRPLSPAGDRRHNLHPTAPHGHPSPRGSHNNLHVSHGSEHPNGSRNNLHHHEANSHSLPTSTGNLAHSSNEDINRPHSRNRRDISAHTDTPEINQPLLETDANNPKPPLAGPEIDDIDDDDDIPATAEAHPGVDDGFYDNGIGDPHSNDPHHPDDRRETDDEGHPKDNHGQGKPDDDDGHSRSDDETTTMIGGDDTDGYRPDGHGNYHAEEYVMHSRSNFGDAMTPNGHHTPRFDPNTPFPYAPGFGPNGQPVSPDINRITPDVNVYQQKKNLAQGMMDLALLSANANQLRYVLEAGDFHPYYYPSLVFISMSLIIQIAVGVGLIINSRYNVKNHDDICIADRINNFTVIGIFIITVVNVFIAAFGVGQMPGATSTVVAVSSAT